MGSIHPPNDDILRGYQAPNQRLVFLYVVLSRQVVRSFMVVHSTPDPLVERSIIVVHCTHFPFSPRSKGKTTCGIRTLDIIVCQSNETTGVDSVLCPCVHQQSRMPEKKVLLTGYSTSRPLRNHCALEENQRQSRKLSSRLLIMWELARVETEWLVRAH